MISPVKARVTGVAGMLVGVGEGMVGEGRVLVAWGAGDWPMVPQPASPRSAEPPVARIARRV
jgi:hypothetical protein